MKRSRRARLFFRSFRVNNNFTSDFDDAVKLCTHDPTCKLGWQANERFWESNKNQIYGGISYTDDPRPLSSLAVT